MNESRQTVIQENIAKDCQKDTDALRLFRTLSDSCLETAITWLEL